YIALLLVSLLPLALVRIKRWQRPGNGRVLFVGFAGVWVLAVFISPLFADGQRLYYQLRPVDFAGIAPEYQVPTQPLQRPRNIVWIYGESLERTYLDENVFPGLMPNLN